MGRTRSLGRLARGGCLGVALCVPWPYGSTPRAETPGCTTLVRTDPPHEVLECADGLRITVEKGATYTLVDRDKDRRPDAIELKGRALLIEVSPRRRGGFQILTPHAVASVRGTTWAVDVTGSGTSVLVEAGRVGVARSGTTGGAVVLKAGDGVDVEPGSVSLAVKSWSRERRLHLLARFGR
ncbi:MAG TPA: FecR family protein [Geminicoccaceae bacterium]